MNTDTTVTVVSVFIGYIQKHRRPAPLNHRKGVNYVQSIIYAVIVCGKCSRTLDRSKREILSKLESTFYESSLIKLLNY